MKVKLSRFWKDYGAGLLIIFLALLMRLVVLNQSLWLDESIGALAVRDYSYTNLLNNFLQYDNHPPLYYFVLKFWTSLFSYSEVSIRMTSVIFGLFTILLTYLIAKMFDLGTKDKFNPAILSMFLIAISPFHIYYSQEARMYSQASFFAACTIYLYLRIIKLNKYQVINWFLFSLSLTALVFTDYVPIFLLPVLWLWLIISRAPSRMWIYMIISHVPLLILGFLWSPTFLLQSENGKWLLATLPQWKKVAGGATVKQVILVWMKFVFGRVSLINKKLYYAVVFVSSIPYFYSLFKAVTIRRLHFIWLWLLIPPALVLLFSFSVPIFIYFRLMYILPAFYILISFGLFNVKSKGLRNTLFTAIIMVNMLGWTVYVYDKNQQREDWRSAVAYVEDRLLDDEIVLFSYPDPFSPYRWYSNKPNRAFGATDSISADEVKTEQITSRLVSNKKGVYYFEYLSDLGDPEDVVRESIISNGYKESRSTGDFKGVGKITYYQK